MTSRTLSLPGGTAIGAVSAVALVAFLDAIFNDLWTANGIHGTEGAHLVVVSMLLLATAAALIAWGRVHGWLKTVLEVLIGLDFLGTALAAYLLEAWILLTLTVIGAIVWIVHLARPVRPAQAVRP